MDPYHHGEFFVVEPGDAVEAVERDSECPILTNHFDDLRYPSPEFVPAWEVVEEHDSCFEMVFVANDEGTGVILFIPKCGIDPLLSSLCAAFAVPADT
jgi:hypothetical protein